MRTAIELPDDLYQQALAIARDTDRTFSETVADLLRRGITVSSSGAISHDPRTGLPLVSVGRAVSSEDVRLIEDVPQDELAVIRCRCTALPVLDDGTADEIIGYNDRGLPR